MDVCVYSLCVCVSRLRVGVRLSVCVCVCGGEGGSERGSVCVHTLPAIHLMIIQLA